MNIGKGKAMRIESPKTIQFLLSIPIIAFLAVVDQAAWTLVLIFSVPMLLAWYFPSKAKFRQQDSNLWEEANNPAASDGKSSFKIEPVHFLIVAIAIFVLDTTPKKLNKQPCSEEMALTSDEQPTSVRDKVVVISSFVGQTKIGF
ncbi:MAG: hypothetical protein HKN76_11580 [Saprospiraceae bacterium]|nr:hypothetical protein [Saprospiraceae bacterium]